MLASFLVTAFGLRSVPLSLSVRSIHVCEGHTCHVTNGLQGRGQARSHWCGVPLVVVVGGGGGGGGDVHTSMPMGWPLFAW